MQVWQGWGQGLGILKRRMLKSLTKVCRRRERTEVESWAPKVWRPTRLTVFHGCRVLTGSAAKREYLSGWGEDRLTCARDQRPILFSSKRIHSATTAPYLQSSRKSKKTEKPNNGSDEAAKRRYLFTFPLKVSLKHLCISQSSLNIESLGHLHVLHQ
jgi:hypothetical protein